MPRGGRHQRTRSKPGLTQCCVRGGLHPLQVLALLAAQAQAGGHYCLQLMGSSRKCPPPNSCPRRGRRPCVRARRLPGGRSPPRRAPAARLGRSRHARCLPRPPLQPHFLQSSSPWGGRRGCGPWGTQAHPPPRPWIGVTRLPTCRHTSVRLTALRANQWPQSSGTQMGTACCSWRHCLETGSPVAMLLDTLPGSPPPMATGYQCSLVGVSRPKPHKQLHFTTTHWMPAPLCKSQGCCCRRIRAGGVW